LAFHLLNPSIKNKRRKKMNTLPLVAWLIILVLLLGTGFAYWGNISGGNALTYNLSEPLEGAKTANVDIDTGSGNLTIDRLTSDEPVLANGTLQYFGKQGLPARTLSASNGQTKLTLRGGDAGRPWFRFPWAACNGGTEWRIHLNPQVPLDITAHSGGGNVKLDLAGMAVTRVMADTGGGNMDVVLPDNAADLGVAAETGAGNVIVKIGRGITGTNTVVAHSGAGNVVVQLPSGVAARIHATSGLGKVTVDARFSQTDKDTYQSSDYDGAAHKVEIAANSGAGNVSINTE
jgi:hypothetical protein